MKLAKNWHSVLQEEIQKPYVQELKRFLDEERKAGEVYPPESLVFNAFAHTPFEEVKVVIMGQDPYHGLGQAHGLSFSVQHGVRPPPSLQNMFKELESDLGITPPDHGCLTAWAKQGVLMLNATLTVRARAPKSHYGRGWETFTDAVIEKLAKRKSPLVFLLWGRSAKEKCERVLPKDTPHAVLTAPHPSPYSAASGFFGSRHFSKANEHLIRFGKTPINWDIKKG